MKNLFQFLYKNTFFFLFLLLEVLAFSLLVSNNSFQRTSFISASNGITAGMLSAVSDATNYFGLREENKILVEENAVLRSRLIESNLWTNRSFRSYSDTVKEQFYTYKEAQVISNSFRNRNNYLILNKGKYDGVKTEMGVITSEGVVGIVNNVSDHFCTVLSVLHKISAIDVKITSNGYTGTTKWNGGDYTKCKLLNIPSHSKIRKGDTLVTSGNSAIFPPEIPMGYVSNYNLKAGQNFYDIDFKFSVDYNKLRHVYIVNNLRKEELKNLKEKLND